MAYSPPKKTSPFDLQAAVDAAMQLSVVSYGTLLRAADEWPQAIHSLQQMEARTAWGMQNSSGSCIKKVVMVIAGWMKTGNCEGFFHK